MIPRVTAPATVRVTGDFMICSNVDGGAFAARPAGVVAVPAGALSAAACCTEAAFAASISRALSRSTVVAYFLTCGEDATR